MKVWGWVVVAMHGMLVAAFAAAPTFEAVSSSPVSVAELARDASGMTMRLELAAPTWETIETEQGSVVRAEYLEAGMAAEAGEPAVPVASRFFRMPATGGVSVQVSNLEYETLSDVDYALYVNETTVPVYGKNTTPQDAWYPENIVSVTEPAIMRDFRVAMLQSYPVQVNPARREVRVYSSYDVELSFTNESSINELPHWPTQISENYLSYYREFLDWSDNELDEFVLYRGGVQVVTRTNALELLAPWLEWKRQKGWEIDLLTQNDVTSFTASNIRNELVSRYTNSDPKFDFIVIVGDANGTYEVPAAGFVSYGYGDHNYTTLAGTDALSDVAIGRISVEQANELAGYVNKVLFYEKTPYTTDSGWYHRGVVAAGSASSGLSTVHLGRYARHLMLGLGYTQVDTAWFLQHSSTEVNNITAAALNNGVSFFNYRGYIGSGLSVTQILALNNSFKLPFVIDVTCGTGNWHGGTGHNEAWMRAGTPTNPKGGIGAIATATSSTKTRPNNAIAGGAIRSYLVYRNPNMGMTWFGAMVNLYVNINANDANEVNQFSVWNNLMGDPTVWLWTDIPHELTVSASPTFQLGQNGYSVTVQEGAVPVEGAWVTLYKSDTNEEVIARGISGANGQIILDAPFRHAGSAVLTVTKQNFEPEIVNVNVVSVDRVGYVSYTIVDNGSEGTSGNNNGVAEASETVGIRFTAKNYGTASHTGVTATMSESEPRIASVSGTANFGTIAAGAEAVATSLILVEIQPNMQNEWIAHLGVTVNSGDASWNDQFSIQMAAPKFALVNTNVTGTLNPGDSATLNLVLRNVGESIAAAGTATLYSLDSYLGIENSAVNFATTTQGQNVTIGPYTVHSHSAAFRGYPARYKLVISTNSGQVDTVYSQLTLGSRQASDPVGPDRYGYFGFDNTDTNYDIAPVYDWVEINPTAPNSDFNGTRFTSINDASEDDDDAQTLTLPFPIQYYGETFNTLTATGNGIVAMGSQADMSNARNWTIPSPLGPNYMIAPYWDDRYMAGGGVYHYYDEPNGRLIIEWYQVKDANNSSPCTFQVIFYDQVEGHLTLTGDNEFAFQYNTMNHSAGAYYDVPYYTVGIENGDQTDGLMCAYWNQTMPGMASISSGRAILFTTQIELITGSVTGRVTALADGSPIEGVTVHTDDWIFQTQTDANGDYLIENVIIGVHDFYVSGSCVNTAVAIDIAVQEDETTTVNFQATVPQFAVSPEQLIESINQNAERTIPLVLSNDGDGPTDFSVSVDFWGPDGFAQFGENNPRGPIAGVDELDEIWQLLYSYDIDLAVEPRNRGITHDEEYFWVSGSNNLDASGPNKLYQYDNSGELIATYNQPVPNPSVVGFYGMTWDGAYLYGADENTLYQMEYTGTDVVVVDSWEIPVNPARYLTYDSLNDWFWMGDYSTPLYAVDRDGNVHAQYTYDFSIAAVGFFAADPDGMNLYLIARDPGDQTVSVYRADPTSEAVVFATNLPADGFQIKDIDITYYWNPLRWTITGLLDGLAAADEVKVWELAENTTWMELSHESGTIPPGSEFTVNVTLRGLDLPEGDYGAYLRFDHHTCDEVTYVEVDIHVNEVGVADVTVQPLEWAFDGAYPNPFNPTTTIRFSLKETAHVQARLFNVMGQEVAMIKDGPMTAGQHHVVVNGNQLASGVYFLTFEAGPLHTTRKLVLLK